MARKDTITNALLRADEQRRDGNYREARAAERDAATATDAEWADEFGIQRGGDDWWMSCVE